MRKRRAKVSPIRETPMRLAAAARPTLTDKSNSALQFLGALIADPRFGRERLAGLALVVLLHLLVLWTLALTVHAPVPVMATPDISVEMMPVARHAPSPPPFLSPSAIDVAPPQIEIAPDAGTHSTAITATVGPRFDPAFQNVFPLLPSDVRVSAKPSPVVLRILVSASGAITDATLAVSSGNKELDDRAIAFVKANWRYLPAMIDGVTVQVWTTVAVQFRNA